jgi:L-ascorbate metabolism protein UlaG (beta-lactamase superfamily)
VGDSIYNDHIKQNIEDLKPDYIIINSGGAEFPEKYGQNIIMNAAEVKQLIKDLNFSTTIIAIHMDAIDHCKTTRILLKNELKNIPESAKLVVPEDGETIVI